MRRYALDQLNPIVAFLDPAGKPKNAAALKRVRARSALVVIGLDPLLRIPVLQADAGRWTTTETIERMYRAAEAWRVNVFGVEANAMQERYASMIADHARTSGRYLPIQEVYQPTGVDKLWRIRTILQPVLARGRLAIDPTRQQELHVELQGFPTSRTVDLVDALASAIAMLPNRTAVASSREERTKLEDYLVRTGVAPDAIADRMERFDAEARMHRPSSSPTSTLEAP